MTPAEYNKVVDLYSDNVYRFILKNLRDKEKSQDVVQDSFEKLWINVEKVNFDKARSYLFTTAYRTMIDAIRKEKYKSSWDATETLLHAHSEQYSDVGEILEKAIMQLPDDQRSAIMLRDYEGYSYKEIEEITGLNEAQVKVYIYRARLFLKNFIGQPEVLI
ncbi:MAG: RNA polymerase sigma factor [Bacteroidetes bacterium HGW-Bacteroidetes-21]|jgi:RNA polymerase sigma-70 factor (ECF subfamily)|nr:MAG: RNA polymerase sigma factor [Bacteroidetes bacterium HGW-Bacteroidetes-21]